MNDVLKIEVGEEVLTPIIKEKIQAAILQATAEDINLINKIVEKTLNARVNQYGVRMNDGEYSYVEFILRQSLQKYTQETITQLIEEKSTLIRAEIKKQISSKKTSSSFVEAILTAMMKGVSSDFRLSPTFTMEVFKEEEDEDDDCDEDYQ